MSNHIMHVSHNHRTFIKTPNPLSNLWLPLSCTGEVDNFSFFNSLGRFCVLLIKLNYTFSVSYIILPYYVYYYCIFLGSVRPSGLLFFLVAFLLSILMPLSLPSSSVSLSYFILAVPIREGLGKHLCISSQFSIAILNGTFFFGEIR